MDAVTAKGVTPASNSPTDIATAISNIPTSSGQTSVDITSDYGTDRYTLSVYTDDNGDYTNSKWIYGTTKISCISQTLNIAFAVARSYAGLASYCDIYVRDVNNVSSSTKIGRLYGQSGGATNYEGNTNSPKVFSLPNSGTYYIDFYFFGKSYGDNGTKYIYLTLNSVNVQ